jgi:hypothetical protein
MLQTKAATLSYTFGANVMAAVIGVPQSSLSNWRKKVKVRARPVPA